MKYMQEIVIYNKRKERQKTQKFATFYCDKPTGVTSIAVYYTLYRLLAMGQKRHFQCCPHQNLKQLFNNNYASKTICPNNIAFAIIR